MTKATDNTMVSPPSSEAGSIADTLIFDRTADGPADSLLPRQTPLPGHPAAEHWHIPASEKTVHWGYFSKALAPLVRVKSGTYLTIECLTNNASDDYERFIKGDAGAESVFFWTRTLKNVDRRGAGSLDSPIGAGGGNGPHICSGPVYVEDAEPGDVLEVEIVDMYPRRSPNPLHRGKAFGVNIAGRWGFHCAGAHGNGPAREILTVYEIDTERDHYWARPLYSFQWKPVRDPFGVVHHNYDYFGLILDHGKIERRTPFLDGVRVPLRPHFGVLGVAPREADIVSSGPPNYTGGNIDNWRIAKGATLYLPVAVNGALFSVGDAHAAQGDGEISGSAIESSWTGVFRIVLHKRQKLGGTFLHGLDYPLLENKDEWIVHGFSYPNYLAELGPSPGRDGFSGATTDTAMRDAYRKILDFLTKAYAFDQDEAVSLISVAVDFGVTQVVDGNLGVHAILQKRTLQQRRVSRP